MDSIAPQLRHAGGRATASRATAAVALSPRWAHQASRASRLPRVLRGHGVGQDGAAGAADTPKKASRLRRQDAPRPATRATSPPGRRAATRASSRAAAVASPHRLRSPSSPHAPRALKPLAVDAGRPRRPPPASPTLPRASEALAVELPAALRLPARRDGHAPRPSSPGGRSERAAREGIRDRELKAEASRRAGLPMAEAVALLGVAILHDNVGEHAAAVAAYGRAARMLEALPGAPDADDSDTAAAAQALCVAYNGLASAHQRMGPEHARHAVYYHAKHRDAAAGDRAGLFVAHTNLGLAYAAAGQPGLALTNHRHALRFAILSGSVAAQSAALGNLGGAEEADHHLATARACVERRAQLSAELGEAGEAAAALAHLGHIADQQGELGEAVAFHERAFEAAEASGDPAAVERAKVELGVARGNLAFEARVCGIAEAIEQQQQQEQVA